MPNSGSDKFIDVEQLIRSKNPTLLKWLPKFLLKYIKRIIHQKDINNFISLNHDKYNEDYARAALDHIGIKVEIKGVENIPKTGGVVFTANHPLGGMDAMALISEISPYRKDIKFIVNDVLMSLKNLKDMFVGVNKHGKSSKESFEQVNQLFASDQAVCIFPAGLVSRRKKGVIKDLAWKRTFILKAIETDHPVVPIYVSGGLSNFFYNLANFRETIGIKANVEMFYLANELFKQKGHTIKIIVGKPIDASKFDATKTQHQWAEWVKEKVYSLNQ